MDSTHRFRVSVAGMEIEPAACCDCLRSVARQGWMITMSENRLSCEEVVKQLFAYLDADLDETTSAHIHQHLETCRACCSRLEFEKSLRTRIQESGTRQAPERLQRRIRKILDRY